MGAVSAGSAFCGVIGAGAGGIGICALAWNGDIPNPVNNKSIASGLADRFRYLGRAFIGVLILLVSEWRGSYLAWLMTLNLRAAN